MSDPGHRLGRDRPHHGLPGSLQEPHPARQAAHPERLLPRAELRRSFGGCAGNIAYHLQLLGDDPLILATVGSDFGAYADVARPARHPPRRASASSTTRTPRRASSPPTSTTTRSSAFHAGAMERAAEAARRGRARDARARASSSPNGKRRCVEHARALKARGVPTVIDPGQRLPIFDARRAARADRRRGACYVVNDYEWALTLERTGLDGAGARAAGCGAVVVTRGRAGLDDPRAAASASRSRPCARPRGRRSDRLRRRLPRRPALRHRARAAARDGRPHRQPDGRARGRAARHPVGARPSLAGICAALRAGVRRLPGLDAQPAHAPPTSSSSAPASSGSRRRRRSRARGRAVLVLERATAGSRARRRAATARSIHAGLYYPAGSLKARLCVEGARARSTRAASGYGIPHRRLGKLVVAVEPRERAALERAARARRRERRARSRASSTATTCGARSRACARVAALRSPRTGIVDAHALCLSLRAEAEAHGAALALRHEVVAIERARDGYRVGDARPRRRARALALRRRRERGGPRRRRVAALAGIDVDARGYRLHPCKGDYFALAPGAPLRCSAPRVPGAGGRRPRRPRDARPRRPRALRPRREYVERARYDVDPARRRRSRARRGATCRALRAEWLTPDHAGVRPKLAGPGEAFRDFVIEEESCPAS